MKQLWAFLDFFSSPTMHPTTRFASNAKDITPNHKTIGHFCYRCQFFFSLFFLFLLVLVQPFSSIGIGAVLNTSLNQWEIFGVLGRALESQNQRCHFAAGAVEFLRCRLGRSWFFGFWLGTKHHRFHQRNWFRILAVCSRVLQKWIRKTGPTHFPWFPSSVPPTRARRTDSLPQIPRSPIWKLDWSHCSRFHRVQTRMASIAPSTRPNPLRSTHPHTARRPESNHGHTPPEPETQQRTRLRKFSPFS